MPDGIDSLHPISTCPDPAFHFCQATHALSGRMFRGLLTSEPVSRIIPNERNPLGRYARHFLTGYSRRYSRTRSFWEVFAWRSSGCQARKPHSWWTSCFEPNGGVKVETSRGQYGVIERSVSLAIAIRALFIRSLLSQGQFYSGDSPCLRGRIDSNSSSWPR